MSLSGEGRTRKLMDVPKMVTKVKSFSHLKMELKCYIGVRVYRSKCVFIVQPTSKHVMYYE